MQTMRDHRFSHGTGLLDCLIASICYRLELPILTDNIKDYARILSADLVHKPY